MPVVADGDALQQRDVRSARLGCATHGAHWPISEAPAADWAAAAAHQRHEQFCTLDLVIFDGQNSSPVKRPSVWQQRRLRSDQVTSPVESLRPPLRHIPAACAGTRPPGAVHGSVRYRHLADRPRSPRAVRRPGDRSGFAGRGGGESPQQRAGRRVRCRSCLGAHLHRAETVESYR
jgi:hypothetical protein